MAITRKEKILIFGGNGYFGEKLNFKFLQSNYKVIILTSKNKKSKNKKLKYIKHNFLKLDKRIIKLITKNSIVINLAWNVNPDDYLRSDINYNYFKSSIELAKICKQKKVKSFFGFGSCFEYDFKKEILTIDTNLKPKTLYSYYKSCTFLASLNIFRNSNTSFHWFRPFFVYGGKEKKGRLIPSVRSSIEKKKKFTVKYSYDERDYLHIDVAIQKIFNYIVKIKNKNCVINICSGKSVSIKQLLLSIFDEDDCKKYIIFNNNKLNKNRIIGGI